LKGMVEANEERVRAAKLQEALYRHYASSGVPKGLHCLALKLTAMETSQDMKRYYHGDHTAGTNISQYSPTILAAYLQARSPKYISILNHLRIYLPEVCLSTLLQVSFMVLCANDAQQVIYFWVSGGSSEM
jgi:hypothetical protein